MVIDLHRSCTIPKSSASCSRFYLLASTLTQLALHIPIEDLLIPPAVYLQDRKFSPDIFVPFATGRRAFAAKHPLPTSVDGKPRLPRVLREASAFILSEGIVEIEGIFRVSPSTKLKDVLKEAYDRGQKFIVWREGEISLPMPKYPDAIDLGPVVDDIDQSDCYGSHLAASLIKQWYTDLAEPIIPQAAYREIKNLYGNPTEEVTVEHLVELFAPFSEWSPLPAISREIVTRHLFPMLWEVARHQETNKMTPDNLAVCFSPNLLCGPDQVEDARMSQTLRRIIGRAVVEWEKLMEPFGVEKETFWNDMKAPEKLDDYEDPLEHDVGGADQGREGGGDMESQTVGIILRDAEDAQSEGSGAEDQPVRRSAPPLPPRSFPRILTLQTQAQAPLLPPRSVPESPASSLYELTPVAPLSAAGDSPTSGLPPGYLAGADLNFMDSPSSYTGPVDGFGPPRRGDWSVHGSEVDGDPHDAELRIETRTVPFSVISPPPAIAVKRKPVGASRASSDVKASSDIKESPPKQ
jgi:Rho GTPase-activating protein 1